MRVAVSRGARRSLPRLRPAPRSVSGAAAERYVVSKLVADRAGRAANADPALVNAWGIAASPTGPWWTSNEARGSSTLYSGDGRKQLLTVTVDGGPTGVAYYGGKRFRVAAGRASDPARFIYACEDGKLRAWTPTVPTGWSTRSEVVVDEGAEAAVFRGVALAGDASYATDFHNARVDVYDGRWRRVRVAAALRGPGDPVVVRAVRRAGDRRPPLRDVRRARPGERQRRADGRLRRRVRPRRTARRARRSHGRAERAVGPGASRRAASAATAATCSSATSATVASTPIGARTVAGRYDGVLRDRRAKPIVVNGLWGIGFGNGGAAGPRDDAVLRVRAARLARRDRARRARTARLDQRAVMYSVR